MASPDVEPANLLNERVPHSIRLSLGLLQKSDRRKYGLAVLTQMALALLDLAGVLLVGLVGALAVAGLQGDADLPAYATSILDALGLGDTDLIRLAMYAAVAASAFLVVKSIVAAVLIRKILRFLARRQAQVASRLAGELFAQPLTIVERRSSQETAYALMDGTTQATVLLLGSLAIGLGDVALLALLGGALFVIDPVITLVAIAFFVAIGFLLQRILGSLASSAGNVAREMGIAGVEAIQETMASYREITVSNRRSLYRDRIGSVIWATAGAQADIQFVGQVPKFVFETALVVGAMALVATQSVASSPVDAVATMALFLAAGARVMPSLLRLQVATIHMRSAGSRALPTYELDKELRGQGGDDREFDLRTYEEGVHRGHPGFIPTLEITDLRYRYPASAEDAITGVDLRLEAGQSLALVGGTGAGKSTLADLILGVLQPAAGAVLIGGHTIDYVLRRWPGAVAYVPQAVSLSSGTVRQNVALGIPMAEVDDDRVWEALDRARLGDFLRDSRDGLDTIVGERGVRLSGGQRQRLGIARALYSRPKFLVLDEATSSLDAETESAITTMLEDLAGTVTTVTIAHRLATVRNVDVLVFLDNGLVSTQGTFEEVRSIVPAFDRQARLLGL